MDSTGRYLVVGSAAYSGQAQIEVAGLRVGTLTHSRTISPKAVVYEQISDVKFWFFGKIKIYYRVVSRHEPNH